jgi:hypothetical protein
VPGADLRHAEGARLAAFDELEDVEAGTGSQRLALISPTASGATARTKTSGSRSAGRRPSDPPRSRLASSDTSRATVAKSSPARKRASAASARARRSAMTASEAPSGTVTRICDTSSSVTTPACARRASMAASISPSVMRMRLATSRSRTRSNQDLLAQAGAEALVVHAFAAQPLAQLRHRELVLRRDVRDRALDLGLVDLEAAVAGVRHQDTLVDEHIEHLAAELGGRRQRLPRALRFVAHAVHAHLQLARGDELLVDDGDDVVGRGDLGLGRERQDEPERSGRAAPCRGGSGGSRRRAKDRHRDGHHGGEYGV